MILAKSVLRYLISLSNIAINSLLIGAIYKCKKLKLLSFWFILWLSISDALVGFTSLIRESCLLASRAVPPLQRIQFFAYVMENFCINFSSTLVLIVALDRYIHMKHPLQYSMVMTKRRALVLGLCNTIFTIHTITTVILLPKYERPFLLKNAFSYRIYRVVLSLVYILTVGLIFVIYVTTYFLIRKKTANVGKLVVSLQVKRNKQTGAPVNKEGQEEIALKTRKDPVACPDVTDDDVVNARKDPVACPDVTDDDVVNARKDPVACPDVTDDDVVNARKETLVNGKMTGNDSANVQREVGNGAQKPRIYSKRMRRPDREFSIATGLIMLSLLVCLIPNFSISAYATISLLVNNGRGSSFESLGLAVQWTYLLLQLNSSINAAIILGCSRELRRFTKRVLWLKSSSAAHDTTGDSNTANHSTNRK